MFFDVFDEPLLPTSRGTFGRLSRRQTGLKSAAIVSCFVFSFLCHLDPIYLHNEHTNTHRSA